MENKILELRDKVIQYYSIESDSEEVKSRKKNFINKILEKQNLILVSKEYKEKLKSISSEINLEVENNSVSFHPSFKLKVLISRREIEHIFLIKEIYIWISNIEKIYTVFEMDYVAEKFNIKNKSKYLLYNAIIFSEGTDDTGEDFEKIKKSIESNWAGYSFINIKSLLGKINIDWITYTTEKNNLFHAYFGSFSPNDYKII